MRGLGSDIEYGIRRAILETISGFVSSLLLEYLFWALEEVSSNVTGLGVSIELVKDLIVLLVMLMSLVDVLHTMEKMKYWKTEYLIGFLVGFAAFEAITGSLDAFSLILIIFGIMVIIVRGIQASQLQL